MGCRLLGNSVYRASYICKVLSVIFNNHVGWIVIIVADKDSSIWQLTFKRFYGKSNYPKVFYLVMEEITGTKIAGEENKEKKKK